MKKAFFIKQIVPALVACVFLLSGCRDATPPAGPAITAETEYVSTDAVSAAAETDAATAQTETAAPVTDSAAETERTAPLTGYLPPETAEPIRSPQTEEAATEPKNEVQEDSNPPFFLHFAYTVTLARGSEFDVHKYISYIDDTDPDVDLNVDGSVDTGTVGEYRLKVTITDDCGNSTASSMTVSVADVDPSEQSDSPYTYDPPAPRSFADFAATYKKSGTMVGIDVSKWQGPIDFDKVAAAGCEFVIIRIGGYAGGLFEDPYYSENIRKAKTAGLKVGVYWYSEENGPGKVHENAGYLYSLLNGEKLDFPVFFDWEDYFDMENYKMSMKDLNEMFLAFRDEAKAHGYGATLYNSAYYLDLLWSDEVKGDGVWLANYTDKTDYQGKYFLWQQGFGRIDGIDGDVDVNVYYPSVMKSYS